MLFNNDINYENDFSISHKKHNIPEITKHYVFSVRLNDQLNMNMN